MNILVAEGRGFSPRAAALLEAHGGVTLSDLDRPALLSAVGDAHVLVVRLRNRIDDEVLAAAPSLGALVTPTTGLDHVDLSAADARGVAVLSLRGEVGFLRSVAATAEHTWALLLALTRGIPAASEAVRAGSWDRDRFRGRELSGKVLGVVGLGRVGRMVARYGEVFDMEVVGYDPHPDGWPGAVERMPDLGTLLERADVVTLHVPLTDETRGMLDAGALARMKPGAVLVNTSRGAVVDEAALVAAIGAGRLAGAALDVVTAENTPEGPSASPAVAFAARDERLLVTPHIGGATLESMENTEIFMAEKLARWLRGDPVRVDAGPPVAPRRPPFRDSAP